MYRLREGSDLLGPEWAAVGTRPSCSSEGGGRACSSTVDGPVPGAQTLADGGFLVPGLVDAHCHVGSRPARSRAARRGRRPGADRPGRRDAADPRLRLPGRHPAAAGPPGPAGDHPGRPAPRPAQALHPGPGPRGRRPGAAARGRRGAGPRGDGWVKLVGDWIDREVGDLAPLWPDDVLVAAIEVAHAEGARVTAHVFGTDALPGLIGAGIDCIEHGTG